LKRDRGVGGQVQFRNAGAGEFGVEGPTAGQVGGEATKEDFGGDRFDAADMKMAGGEVAIGEHGQFAGVKAAVADQDGAAGEDLAINAALGAVGMLEEGPDGGGDVGEFAGVALQTPIHELNSPCVEASAGDNDEAGGVSGAIGTLVIGDTAIDLAEGTGLDGLPGEGRVGGEAEFMGEDVGGAERQDGEGGMIEGIGGIGDPVEDFEDGPIATGGDDEVMMGQSGLTGERACGAGAGGGEEFDIVSQAVKELGELAGFVAASGRVEDDASAHEHLDARDGLAGVPDDGEDAPEQKAEDHADEDDAVAGDAPFVAQGPESLDASGGEVIDEFFVGWGWIDELALESAPPFGPEGAFEADFDGLAAGGLRGFGFEGAGGNVLEYGFVGGWWSGLRAGMGRFGSGGGGRGRAGAGLGWGVEVLVEARDFGLEFGDAPIEGLSPLGEGIGLFLKEAHAGGVSLVGLMGSASGEDKGESGPDSEDGESDGPSQGESETGEFAGGFALEERGGLLGLGGESGATGEGGRLLGQDGPFDLGRVPLHAGTFECGERAGEFAVVGFCGPGTFVERGDLIQRGAEVGEGAGHLLGVAPRGLFGFVEQGDAASEVGEHFLAALLVFDTAAAGFFELGAFAFEVLLATFEFDESLLGGGDLLVDLVAGEGALAAGGRGGSGRGRHGSRDTPQSFEVGVDKVRMIQISTHGRRMLGRVGVK